jgi:hypothetical protein
MTSKLLLLHAVREIAARSPVTPDSNVVITTTTPGLCWSGLYRELPWFIYPFYFAIMSIFARKTEVGSRLLVDAVKPTLGVEAHGAFLLDETVMNEYICCAFGSRKQLTKRQSGTEHRGQEG